MVDYYLAAHQKMFKKLISASTLRHFGHLAFIALKVLAETSADFRITYANFLQMNGCILILGIIHYRSSSRMSSESDFLFHNLKLVTIPIDMSKTRLYAYVLLYS